MSANTYLITGASDGIGKALALKLARTDATIIMHGRNPQKLEQARAEVEQHGNESQLHTVLADFSSLEQVAALGDEIATKFGSLNILINNAGHLTDHWQASQDGYELTFAVNYLASFLLTHKLLDTLKANAPARIVNVSSTAMGGGYINFDDLQCKQNFDGWQAYSNSKLANILFSHLLAEKLHGSNVVSNSLCPGLIDTNFMHTNTVFDPVAQERMKPMMRPPQQGADVPLYLATADAMADVSGEFFIRDGQNQGKAMRLRWDRDVAEQLWAVSCDYVSRWL